MKPGKTRISTVIVGLVLLSALVYAFLPTPVPVDTAIVQGGPLRITVDEDGQTRIKDHYVVSTPVAGRVLRIELEPGDPVEAEQTLLAVIEPSDPQLLDPRVRAQNEARVKAAEASKEQAVSNLGRAKEAYEFAKTEFSRAQRLIQNNLISRQEYDSAEYQARTTSEELKAAEFAVRIAEFELEQARAALIHTTSSEDDPGSTRFSIRSPITGRVLKRFQESSTVVQSGTPLLEIGDPLNLEIVVDVLSTDAVKISPGTKVLIEHWGGDEPLHAQVRLVEPAAFTKISVLGVEEQRVWVVADFIDPPEKRLTLGDAYRIEARIIVWEHEDVLKVPSSALFRVEDAWAVFVIESGRANIREVNIGHNNGLEAEVHGGLEENERVILYPSDRVKDGVSVSYE